MEAQDLSKIEKPVPPAWDSSGYVDDDDRWTLSNMPEVDREMELSRRLDELQRYNDRKQLYDRVLADATKKAAQDRRRSKAKKDEVPLREEPKAVVEEKPAERSPSSSSPSSSSSSDSSSDADEEDATLKMDVDAGESQAQPDETVWDNENINRLLEERRLKQGNVPPVKAMLEISKLRTSLQAEMVALNSTSITAEQRQAVMESIERLNREIESLEGVSRTSRAEFEKTNARLYGVMAINHRNRVEQRQLDVEAGRERLKQQERDRGGEKSKELNPFKRRECNPVVMWDVGKRSPKKPRAEEEKNGGKSPKAKQAPPKPAAAPAPVDNWLKTCADQIDVNDILKKLESGAAANSRLNSIWRAMRRSYRPGPLPVWKEQMGEMVTGEIMSFDEWKRRVAEGAKDDDAMQT